MSEGAWIALAGAGAVAGALCLRRAWLARSGGAAWKWGGWALLAAAVALGSAALGTARGVFIALTVASVAALAVVASGYEMRAAKQRSGRRSLAPEPMERASSWWRSTLRWLLAGPIGMIAAMATGIFYSTWAGGAPQTRLVVGGLLVPVVWGGCMAWTLADTRILRATAVLIGVAAFGFGLSILKGFG